MKHVIITPVYNEEKYLDKYISSIIFQEFKPYKFILVDDNSTDSSSDIIKNYASKYDWIEYVYHPSEKRKSQGSKVIHAFNYGLNVISLNGIDIISKIDADLELPPTYFKEVINVFSNKAKVGITGGYILEKNKGKWCKVDQASYHIRGALKSYRIESFNQIGGLMPILGWDGLDEMKIFYMGWESEIIDIGVKHYRPASSDYDQKDLAFKIGYSKYQNGSNYILTFLQALKRINKKPYLYYSINYLWGYTSALIKREVKNVSADEKKYINKFHYKRIIKINR